MSSNRIVLVALVAFFLAALAVSLVPGAGAQQAERTAREGYGDGREALETQRRSLAARWEGAGQQERTKILAAARDAVFVALTGELIPAWLGTDWDFNGMSQTPGEGAIACGSFVSTVLRDAGFRVERVYMALQASEHIVRTFAPAEQVWTRWRVPVDDVVAHVQGQGRGVYAVGLSFHTGLLVNDGDAVRFCHSAYYGGVEVVCEEAASSRGLLDSTVFVVGPVMTDGTMEAWLEGREIRTHGH